MCILLPLSRLRLQKGYTFDLFLLYQLGYDKLTLYDGSMGEWVKDESLPIETG